MTHINYSDPGKVRPTLYKSCLLGCVHAQRKHCRVMALVSSVSTSSNIRVIALYMCSSVSTLQSAWAYNTWCCGAWCFFKHRWLLLKYIHVCVFYLIYLLVWPPNSLLKSMSMKRLPYNQQLKQCLPCHTISSWAENELANTNHFYLKKKGKKVKVSLKHVTIIHTIISSYTSCAKTMD